MMQKYMKPFLAQLENSKQITYLFNNLIID